MSSCNWCFNSKCHCQCSENILSIYKGFDAKIFNSGYILFLLIFSYCVAFIVSNGVLCNRWSICQSICQLGEKAWCNLQIVYLYLIYVHGKILDINLTYGLWSQQTFTASDSRLWLHIYNTILWQWNIRIRTRKGLVIFALRILPVCWIMLLAIEFFLVKLLLLTS